LCLFAPSTGSGRQRHKKIATIAGIGVEKCTIADSPKTYLMGEKE